MLVVWLANLHVGRGVRLIESDNPLEGLKNTNGDDAFYKRIELAVPGGLLKTIADKLNAGDGGEEPKCWPNPDKLSGSLETTQKKHNAIAEVRCGTKRGVNADEKVSHASMFRFKTVAHLFRLNKNHTILDYGAGCGHQADELARMFSCKSFAMDHAKAAQTWAKGNLKHLTDFCLGTQDDLNFTTESFDFIFSNGAVGQMTVEDQCHAIGVTFMSFLKPGGCAWFGGLGNKKLKDTKKNAIFTWTDVPQQTFMKTACIDKTKIQGPWIMNDNYLFGTSVYSPTDMNNMTYRENSYSVFVCKPGENQEKQAAAKDEKKT